MSLMCQICRRRASFTCSKCQHYFYCCKEHQIEHWRTNHKNNCIKIQTNNEALLAQLLKKRYIVRKQFFQNYANKVFDICLLDGKVMVDLDRKIKYITKDKFDLFQYGASICLLCRLFYLLSDKTNARIVLQNYLIEQQYMLNDLSEIVDINTVQSKEPKEKQLFQRKMSLIATIANLCYVLELECVKYYVLYTKHIEKSFGKTSNQVSNCYFLLGCYFAEEGAMKKAIAFFLKSADCREIQTSGDCYFNIAILYRLQNQKAKALHMFQKALKFRGQQHGEQCKEIAEVMQNIGMVYTEVNDFVTAMFQYEKALKIRLSTSEHNEISQKYKRTLTLIQQLYDKLCMYIEVEEDEMRKPSTFYYLKLRIESDKTFWGNRFDKLQQIKQKYHTKKKKQVIHDQNKKNSQDNAVNKQEKSHQLNLIISEDLSSKLTPIQLYHLSDLQLELSTAKIKSDFSSTHIIGKSTFLQKLTAQHLQTLIKDNQSLFKLLRFQEIYIAQPKKIQKNVNQLDKQYQLLKKNT